MSADNYIFVDNHNGKYRVSMQFMSDEMSYVEDPCAEEYDRFEDATKAAEAMEARTAVVEYGIIVDDALKITSGELNQLVERVQVAEPVYRHGRLVISPEMAAKMPCPFPPDED